MIGILSVLWFAAAGVAAATVILVTLRDCWADVLVLRNLVHGKAMNAAHDAQTLVWVREAFCIEALKPFGSAPREQVRMQPELAPWQSLAA